MNIEMCKRVKKNIKKNLLKRSKEFILEENKRLDNSLLITFSQRNIKKSNNI